jgi:hypothetical protein
MKISEYKKERRIENYVFRFHKWVRKGSSNVTRLI